LIPINPNTDGFTAKKRYNPAIFFVVANILGEKE